MTREHRRLNVLMSCRTVERRWVIWHPQRACFAPGRGRGG